MRNWFAKHSCINTLAHKMAKIKGELAAVAFLLEHYTSQQFDHNSVPGCWQHAHRVQCIHDLTAEHNGLMAQLTKLQNKFATTLGEQ